MGATTRYRRRRAAPPETGVARRPPPAGGTADQALRSAPSPWRGDQGRRLLALGGVVGPLGYLVLVIVLGWLWNGDDPMRDTQANWGPWTPPTGWS